MAQEFTVKKEVREDDSFNELEDIRAFSLDEMNAIIEAYENSPTVSHWASFVKFLFYTGCRPGEAAALRWKHINPECTIIRFSQSYDSRTRITKCTKTETTRIFPCHERLTELLLKIKPNDLNPDEIVFPSKTKKQINHFAFFRTWRGGTSGKRRNSIIQELIEQGKVKQYLKPYSTRHTFITVQVNAGIDAHVIAAWVGNTKQYPTLRIQLHSWGQAEI